MMKEPRQPVQIPLPDDVDLRLFYDGECPFCMREIAWLRRRDARGRIEFVDIAATRFDAGAFGRDLHTFMGSIHAQRPDGSFATGIEVFRRAYAAVGLGWLWAPSRWPFLEPLFDAGYRWFARNRLRLAGRREPELDACASGTCTHRSVRTEPTPT